MWQRVLLRWLNLDGKKAALLCGNNAKSIENRLKLKNRSLVSLYIFFTFPTPAPLLKGGELNTDI